MSRRPNHKPRRHRFRRQTLPGAAPGAFKVDPQAPQPVISVLAYGPDRQTEAEDVQPDELRGYLEKWPITWVNVDGLGNADVLKEVAKVFNIHPLALEDVVHVHQRAKVDHYRDHHYLVTHELELGETIQVDQLSLFLGKKFVVTFQQRGGDCLDPVRERVRLDGSQLRQMGTDYLAYSILDAVVDNYFPALEKLGERLEELEERIVERPSRHVLQSLLAIKRELLALRRVAWPQRDALNVLIRDPIELITDETRIYLRDCYDHLVQIIDLVETYRELGSDLVELQLSSASNRMNEVMQFLTIISTLFIPLTFIVGVYGMNFDTRASPWNMPELKWPYGYPLVWGVMLTIVAGMFAFFYRRGWLSGPMK